MAGMSDVIARLSVFLGLDTAAFERGADVSEKRLKKMERSFEQSGKKLQDLGKKLSLAITAPVAAAGVAVVKMAGDFESSMIKLGISSQASADQLKQMSDLALKLGKDTIFGASDAANAMDELAKSGLSATDILNGAAEATVYLATAAGSELSPAANAITDSMQQFGLTTAQLPEAINQITGAVNQSKLDFQDFALAIGQAGGVAGGLGVEFTDFNTVLAATSSLFASGSDAGTSFKTFLTSLAGNSKQAKDAIAAFGLQFYDANGGLRSMAEIAEELRQKLGGLNEQAKTEVLKTIFGTDAMRTAIGLMNQGADGLDRIAAAIKNTDAAAQAAERMKGFYGQLENLKGAIETLAIRIGQSGVLDVVTALVTRIGDLIDWMSEASPTVLRFTALIAGIAAVVGPTIYAIGLVRASLAPLFVALTTQIGPALLAFGWQLAAIATTAGPAAAALRLLAVAVRGLLVATGVGLAIVALTTALDYLIFGSKGAAKASEEHERQTVKTEAALEAERKTSALLAKAKGDERKAQIEATKASRERAVQALKTAKALQAEAMDMLRLEKLRAAQERQRFEQEATFGGSFGATELGARNLFGTRTSKRAVEGEEAVKRSARAIAELEGIIEGMGKGIEEAVAFDKLIDSIGSRSTGASEGSGGGNKKEKRDRAARTAAQVQDEIDALNVDILRSRAALTNSAEDRAAAELAALAADRASFERQLDLDDDLKAQQKKDLRAARDAADAQQKRAILIEAAEGLAQERFDRESAANALEQEVVSARGAIQDRTAGQRRVTALRLVDLEFSQREDEAMKAYNDATRRGDEVAADIARSKLARIQLLKQFATEEAKLQTMSPIEAYLDQLPKTAAEVNEAFESIAVSGIQSLNDGIANAIVNFKSLGDVFANVAKQIIADLLRIQIQKALVEPLSKLFNLSGSSAQSTVSGVAGLIKKWGGIPGFANGTNFAPGGLSLVGERGPELVDLPRGARVTPNNDLKGFGGGIAQIVPSPYFDVVVDGRVMRAAPGIAQAGAQGGVARMQYAQSRRWR